MLDMMPRHILFTADIRRSHLLLHIPRQPGRAGGTAFAAGGGVNAR